MRTCATVAVLDVDGAFEHCAHCRQQQSVIVLAWKLDRATTIVDIVSYPDEFWKGHELMR